MATNSYIQVPPDSTGKRIQHQLHTIDAQPVHTPVMHIADHDNPHQIQRVDIRGQAAVRFAEGSPTMDPFGNLRVSSQYMIGTYEYSNGPMTELFSETTALGGSITYNSQTSEVTLGVSGLNGSSAQRITNRYHFYQPGVSNHIIQTLYMSDSGKAGNTRRWGYGDHNNGIFFELTGTDLFCVVINSRTGSIVESRTPRNQWEDPLDGTGLSGMNLDLTKANFFWFDYAWLGVGVVRFGILAEDGSRWVVHTERNPNRNIGAYMQTGSLPLMMENFNTSATSGTSEMHLICGAVFAASKPDYTFWRHEVDSGLKTVGTNTPLLSIKPSLTYNGKTNRVGLYPESISVFVKDGTVKLDIFDNATLTGATWAGTHETAVYDTAATSLVADADGSFKSWLLSPGTYQLDISGIYEVNDEGYHVYADGLDSMSMTVSATKLEASASVYVILNYRELR